MDKYVPGVLFGITSLAVTCLISSVQGSPVCIVVVCEV